MRPLAQTLVVGLLADVYAESGGQGSQRTVNSRERCRQYAEKEDDRNVLQSIVDEQVVGIGGQGSALLIGEHHEHSTQQQEQRIDGQECHAVAAHIFLRIAETLAGEVLLHHVLVKARHDDDNECTRDKGKHKAHGGRLHKADIPYMTHKAHIPHIPHLLYLPYYSNEGSEHAERLQRVGPYQRLDAAATGVEPYEGEEHEDGEGYVPAEHEADDIAGHEELRTRTKELREQEERRARLVGGLAEGLQDGVDGGDAVAVIVGQEEVGHDDIARYEAGAYHEVREAGMCHHARDADKRNTRDAGTDHAEGHHVPRRLPLATEEDIIITP